MGEVPVSGKDNAQRNAALSAALRQVLVKLTGRSRLPAERALTKRLRNPGRYLQQFTYETVMSPGAEEIPVPIQVLRVRFDPRAIDALTRSASLPFWSRIRPLTMAWLVVERGTSPGGAGLSLVAAPDAAEGNGQALGLLLERAARLRGIPIVLPLLDLEDRTALEPSDVIGGHTERGLTASRRYGAKSVLFGHLTVQGGIQGGIQGGTGTATPTVTVYNARWILDLSGIRALAPVRSPLDAAEGPEPRRGSVRRFSWQDEGPNLGAITDRAMSTVAEHLAALYAVSSDTPEPVRLRVEGVEGLADYGRLLRYLDSLDIIERISVTGAERARFALLAQVYGGAPALTRLIALGETLELPSGGSGSPPSSPGGALELSLRTVPGQ